MTSRCVRTHSWPELGIACSRPTGDRIPRARGVGDGGRVL